MITPLVFNEQAGNSVQNTISASTKLFNKDGEFVKKFAKAINQEAADTFNASVGAGVKKGFFGTVKQKVADAASFIGEKAVDAGKFIKDKAIGFGQFVSEKTAGVRGFATKKVQPVKDFVTNNIKKLTKKTPESVKTFLTKAAKVLKNPIVLGVITAGLAFFAINKLSKARD